MKRIHYIILTAVLMVLAYCGGQIDSPAPQAQQPVSDKGRWELHVAGDHWNKAWRINTQTGEVDYLDAVNVAIISSIKGGPKLSFPLPGP